VQRGRSLICGNGSGEKAHAFAPSTWGAGTGAAADYVPYSGFRGQVSGRPQALLAARPGRPP
jgi:hypothetical protein